MTLTADQIRDNCLKKIAAALQRFLKRPSDICARYGGEEFAVVYGNTTLDNSKDGWYVQFIIIEHWEGTALSNGINESPHAELP